MPSTAVLDADFLNYDFFGCVGMLVFAGFYNYNMIRSVLFWANYVNIDLNKFVPTVYSGQVTGLQV